MKTPRVFSQASLTVNANSQVSVDSSLFKNHSHTAFVTMLTFSSDLITEPRFHIQPTNGPAWSRAAVPAYAVADRGNVLVVPGTPTASAWRLRYPYPLGVQDALNISLLNGSGSNQVGSVSAHAYRDTSLREPPRRFFAPRILHDRQTSVANASAVVFNVENLRNWGDRPMQVHYIALSSSRNGVNTIEGTPGDTVRLRIKVGRDSWTIKDLFVSTGALWTGWASKIFTSDTLVPSDAIFTIEAFNNVGDTEDFDCLIVGSVEVERR